MSLPVQSGSVYTVDSLIPDCVGRYITSGPGAGGRPQLSNLINGRTYASCWQAFVYWVASQYRDQASCVVSSIGVILFTKPSSENPLRLSALRTKKLTTDTPHERSIPTFRFFRPFLEQFGIQTSAGSNPLLANLRDVSAKHMDLSRLANMVECEPATFRTALTHLTCRIGEVLCSHENVYIELGVGALRGQNKVVTFTFHEKFDSADSNSSDASHTVAHDLRQLNAQLLGAASGTSAASGGTASPTKPHHHPGLLPPNKPNASSLLSATSSSAELSNASPRPHALTMTRPITGTVKSGLTNPSSSSSSSSTNALSSTGTSFPLFLSQPDHSKPTDALPNAVMAHFHRRLKGPAPLDNVRTALEQHKPLNTTTSTLYSSSSSSSSSSVAPALLPPIASLPTASSSSSSSSMNGTMGPMSSRTAQIHANLAANITGPHGSSSSSSSPSTSSSSVFASSNGGLLNPLEVPVAQRTGGGHGATVRRMLERANLPPVLDSFARTLAATFNDEQAVSSLSAKIASSYTPEAAVWLVDPKTSKLVCVGSPTFSVDRTNQSPQQVMNARLQAWKTGAETAAVMSGLPVALNIADSDVMRARVKSAMRYSALIERQIDDSVVPPMKEIWVRRALRLLSARLSSSLTPQAAEALIRSLLQEVKRDYLTSVKIAILDYVLLNPKEQQRLQVPYAPTLSSRSTMPWGMNIPIRAPPLSWRPSIHSAFTNLSHILYANNPVMLQLLDVWDRYKNLLLIEFPNENEGPISIEEFEIRQKHHLAKIQRIFTTQWCGMCEAVVKRYAKDHLLTDGNSSRFFEAVAALMSIQLRTITHRSAAAYHAFFSQYANSPALQFANPNVQSLTSIINATWVPHERAVQKMMMNNKAFSTSISTSSSSSSAPVDAEGAALAAIIAHAKEYARSAENDLRNRLANFPLPAFVQRLEIRKVKDVSKIVFDVPLTEIDKTVVRIFDNVVNALKEISRVENQIFPLLEHNNFLAVGVRGERGEFHPGSHITSLRREVVSTFSRTIRECSVLVALYDEHAHVLDYHSRLDVWLRQPRSLAEYKVEILRHRHIADLLETKANDQVRAAMMLVDCSAVNATLVQRSRDLATQILRHLSIKLLDKNVQLANRFKGSRNELLRRPNTARELKDLENKLHTFRQKEQPLLSRDYAQTRDQLMFLIDLNHRLSPELLAETSATWTLVTQMSRVITESEALVDTERQKMEKHLKDRTQSFFLNLEGLRQQTEHLYTCTDTKRTSEHLARINSLHEKIEKFDADARAIEDQEQLLGLQVTDFTLLETTRNRLRPYSQLWNLYADFSKQHAIWTRSNVLRLDAAQVENTIATMLQTATGLVSTLADIAPVQPSMGGRRGSVTSSSTASSSSTSSSLALDVSSMQITPATIAESIRQDLISFKPHIPLLHIFCNPGMKERHWDRVTQLVAANFREMTLERVIQLRMDEKTIQDLTEISECATKENAISQVLNTMYGEWRDVSFVLQKHKDSGSFTLQTDAVEDIIALLDDHIVKTQTIKGSSFAKPFEEQIAEWDAWLASTMHILEVWVQVQNDWMYLEPVFSSDDILKAMPDEGSLFKLVDASWRKLMAEVSADLRVRVVTGIKSLSSVVHESKEHLETIHAGLATYLESKRRFFPRFYFLSNEDLLEIVSETRDPLRVQPHLKKCFEGVNRLDFKDNLDITGMRSSEGEEVELLRMINPTEAKGLVERWLRDFEDVMRETVADQIAKAYRQHAQIPRIEWITNWPGQIVLAVNQILWTHSVEVALRGGRSGTQTPLQALRDLYNRLNVELQQVVMKVRGPLSSNARTALGALLVIDVHNRDVVQELIERQAADVGSFDWTAQMRQYYEGNSVKVRMITTTVDYGNEYIGNTSRLVITALTDRCYRTLMMALQLNLGGAPEGPAGTGKTETTKDLAKACGMQCVVFNASEGLNYKMMGKFFKGVASAGAWVCFDEFNRLQLEVLSVVAQQILSVQLAKEQQLESFLFEDSEIRLCPSAAVFITMNPGYSGRSELPDNLKALFRPVAMMVPDYALIAQMSLFSFGFSDAHALAKKIVATYKLCSEQLSSQDHYDYGMRAVKTVLTAAQRLKQTEPTEREDVLILRAIVEVNLPKFLTHDIPLFDGIIKDLFPGLSRPNTDYGPLVPAIQNAAQDLNLQPDEDFVYKTVQLYETVLNRHGLMLVGLPFSGKTSVWRVLQSALNAIARDRRMGEAEQGVEIVAISPKAQTIDQLYGAFSPATHEWSDGVLANKFKKMANSVEPQRQWLVLDGPVDAMWIENMNTVLDDNKKLCLVNGQIVQMPSKMNVIFEVRDLAVASPATVSRCGMIYLAQETLGWRPIVKSWISGLPVNEEVITVLEALIEWLVPETLRVVATECGYYSPQVETNLVVALLRLFDTLMSPLYKKVRDPAAAAADEEQKRRKEEEAETKGLSAHLARRRSSLAVADGGVLGRRASLAPVGTNTAAAQAAQAAQASGASHEATIAAAAAAAAAAVMAGDFNSSSSSSSSSASRRRSMGSMAALDGAAAAAAAAAAHGASTSTSSASSSANVLSPEDDPTLIARVEGAFLFALVWSVGAVVDEDGRKKFDFYLREFVREVSQHKLTVNFPKKGTVYDVLFDVDRAKWAAWTELIPTGGFVIPPEAKFQEIIVPTADTVRYFHLINMFVQNKHPLLLCGPTGTGKSVYVLDTLINRLNKAQYLSLVINFSAQTSENQVQSLVDQRLDRRRKGVFGPVVGKSLLVFLDDVNMPRPDRNGVQNSSELLRQYLDHGGWYDLHDHNFRTLVDIQLIAAMGPPGGGRISMSDRFLRHWSQVSVTPFDDASLTQIFSTIIDWHWQTQKFPEQMMSLTEPIVSATKALYSTVCAKLLPTPGRDHYTFNLRDFARVIQGLLLSRPAAFTNRDSIARLWLHEVLRAFGDRLISDADSALFLQWAKDTMEKKLGVDVAAVLQRIAPTHNNNNHNHNTGAGMSSSSSSTSTSTSSGAVSAGTAVDIAMAGGAGVVAPHITSNELRSLYFGDYSTRRHPRLYQEILATDQLADIWKHFLGEYNAVSSKPMKLVMFGFAIEHLSRICRVLKLPGGHALLIGLGGSGKQSLARLAAHVMELELFTIEISKSYDMEAWKNDLRLLLKKAGGSAKPTVFMLSDTQIKDEAFLEDVNSLLNIGEVPNLWGPEEVSEICSMVLADARRSKRAGEGTQLQLMSFFTDRVRANLHIVLCLSPVGDAFRNRLRMFPSLVNCCTIDWFRAWPQDALLGVASSFMSEIALGDDEMRHACVQMCMQFHVDAMRAAEEYFNQQRRRVYVTPTSFLELITTFQYLLGAKRDEVSEVRNRYLAGLDKLESTETRVKVMQIELSDMQPILMQTSVQTDEMMAVVQKETEAAVELSESVNKEQRTAKQAADAAAAIEQECARDLAEVTPVFEAANQALDTLSPGEIAEIRTTKAPSKSIKLVMECLCYLLNIPPARIPDPQGTGKMVIDFWVAAKSKLLADPNMLRTLKSLDKDNIPDKTIQKLQQYKDNPDFELSKLKNTSRAVHSLGAWIYAMLDYDASIKIVRPKREKLAQARADCEVVKKSLDAAHARLDEVQSKIRGLRSNLDSMVMRKAELERKMQTCSIQLQRAEKLLSGLGGEKGRWMSMTEELARKLKDLTGDILVSSGLIAYLGPFTQQYRETIVLQWVDACHKRFIPSSEHFSLQMVLGEPVRIRNWTIAGLPNDSFSIDNAIIVDKTRRWPLMIDPQGQASTWIKNMENGQNLVVIKLTDNYHRALEQAMQFGSPCLLENVGEELDPTLEPLLLRQITTRGGVRFVRFGDQEVEYSESFRLYITTTLRNPHYLPEVCTRVTLLNFMITPEGLEDQLLGIVVAKERPALEHDRALLVVASAQNNMKLKEIEDKILHVMRSSKGNILDDENAIEILSQSRTLSVEIEEKQRIAATTEKEIEVTRSGYKPVAQHAQVLFFCVSELANIESTYQFSLSWFIHHFTKAIAESDPVPDLTRRIRALNKHLTESLYTSVCRALFEKDKLAFAMNMAVNLAIMDHKVSPALWAFILNGGISMIKATTSPISTNPAPEWLTEKGWVELTRLAQLPGFTDIDKAVAARPAEWKLVFESHTPWRARLPESWNEKVSRFQRLSIVRCLRPDKLRHAMREYVEAFATHPDASVEIKFTPPAAFDLVEPYTDSAPDIPIIFVLSSGSDPLSTFLAFAKDSNMLDRVASISLGQGQGPIAAVAIQRATLQGGWVLLQNCHLAASWMPELEKIVREIASNVSRTHENFRLFLTSYPSPSFPVSILERSVKLVQQPLTGLKANLASNYTTEPLNDEKWYEIERRSELKALSYALTFFHCLVSERRLFGPLGWNISYGFNASDLSISLRQLRMLLDDLKPNEHPPLSALHYLTAECNYGGRVTDDWDRRTLNSLLQRFYSIEVASIDRCTLADVPGYTLPPEGSLATCLEHIQALPSVAVPEVFGLHENAEITKDLHESNALLEALQNTSRSAITSAGGESSGQAEVKRVAIVTETVQNVLARLPARFEIDKIAVKYPARYDECMHTVLLQECVRFNKLSDRIRTNLQALIKGLKGETVTSMELDVIANNIYSGKVPPSWLGISYPSLKPFGSYINDLINRLKFMREWIASGQPLVTWFSGLYFPQSFLTGCLQNYVRKYHVAIDEVAYDFAFLDKDSVDEKSSRPADGVYISGLYFDGAAWSSQDRVLVDSAPRVTFSPAPVIWLKPQRVKDLPVYDHYECPVYRVSSRWGTLMTTGHSSNFVMPIRVPSRDPQDKWIRRGVALITQLDD